MKLYFLIGIYVLLFFSSTKLSGQISSDSLRQFVSGKISGSLTEEFYTLMNYSPVWINDGNEHHRTALLAAMSLSANKGLNEKEYDIKFIRDVQNGTTFYNLHDSLEAEIRISEAALHFYGDIANGNTRPLFGYYGLSYTPQCKDIPRLLSRFISDNLLHMLPGALQSSAEVTAIEERLTKINSIVEHKSFRESVIRSNKVTANNHPLLLKLYQLSILDSVDSQLPDKVLIQKVKEAQQLFNLLADGVLRSTILNELNIPLSVRIRQLNLSINYYRWLTCLYKEQSIIVVNIPAAYMKVYRDNKIVLEMKMIVGKRSTPTPSLASKVNEVILYPYWHVPFSIATKELLPAIKRDPGYIKAGNYQILNKAGKVVDPYSVNWKSLSTNNFPYLIRQSTGCDNALGLLKLNFYNPFGVYLHDTPKKASFLLNKRYFSHGCMRMEKPMELGHLVLKDNRVAIDTLEELGCLRNQAPIVVKSDLQMPVVVWYNPVGINSKGKLVFYEDVYGKFVRKD